MQLTKKAVTNKYRNVIKLGYCELYDLLRYRSRLGYTAGIYGWNADIYQLDSDTVLVTGYRPFGNLEPDSKIIDRYHKVATEIMEDNRLHIDEKAKLLEYRLMNFKDEILA